MLKLPQAAVAPKSSPRRPSHTKVSSSSGARPRASHLQDRACGQEAPSIASRCCSGGEALPAKRLRRRQSLGYRRRRCRATVVPRAPLLQRRVHSRQAILRLALQCCPCLCAAGVPSEPCWWLHTAVEKSSLHVNHNNHLSCRPSRTSHVGVVCHGLCVYD